MVNIQNKIVTNKELKHILYYRAKALLHITNENKK